MRTRSIRTGSGYQSSVSRRALARASAGATPLATHGRREHHDRAPVLRLQVAVLVQARAGRALDHALLVRLDLADARGERRGERLAQRATELSADVALLEEHGCSRLPVRSRRQEHERRIDAVEVVERIQRELERLSA